MEKWLEERVHRVELSVGRLREILAIPQPRDVPVDAGVLWFLRKESSICLKRALALWWGLRWGRR